MDIMAIDESNLKPILLALLPKLPALISIVCSSFIIIRVLNSPTKTKIIDRIMLGLSCTDVVSSFNYFLGTWLVPKGQTGDFGAVFGASGTNATCKISGFFTQFAIASPLYNGMLALYYLKTIYYNQKERELYHCEKWFHAIPLAYALFTALFALAFNLYGNVEWLCWIRPVLRDNIMQRHFRVIQWVFLFIPLWTCIVFQSIIMYLLFQKMRVYEEKLDVYGVEIAGNYAIKRMTKKKSSMNESSFASMRENIPSFVRNIGEMMEVSRLSGFESYFASETKNQDIEMLNEQLSQSNGSNEVSCDTSRSCLNVAPDSSKTKYCSLSSVHNNLRNKLSLRVNDDDGNGDSSSMNIEQYIDANDDFEVDKSESFPLETIDEQSENECGLAGRRVSFIKNITNFLESDSNSSESSISISEKKDNVGSTTEADNLGNTSAKELKAEKTTIEKYFKNIVWSFSDTRISRTSTASSFKRNLRSKQIAIQGILYVCAFFITWFFPTLQRITELTGNNFFSIQLLDTALLPLQGFFNFFIYIRPRFMKYREANPADDFWASLKIVLFQRT